jgi:cytochrome c5
MNKNKNTQIEIQPTTFTARKSSAVHLLLALSTTLALFPVAVQAQDRSGQEVVDTVCAKCHATGLNGAPKIGDEKAWSVRASQGLSSLTIHALQGIRNMPAHGGDPKLSDLEITRAVTYMVNQSGGHWVEPESTEELAKERTGEQVVKAQCAKCHAEGVGGAPKIGDLQAWVQRMKQGLPYLVSSAIHGHGGMPPRGGQANLTDTEIRSAILYMYNPAGMPAKPSAGTAAPTSSKDPNHRSVNGIDVYLGVVPAEHIRAFPKGSPERTMHGGVPKGPGYFHVDVSLFDLKSHTPINDAQVTMQYEPLGLSSSTIKLEPMFSGEGSYGNYVKPQTGVPYQITMHIKRPKTDQTVEVKFEHVF